MSILGRASEPHWLASERAAGRCRLAEWPSFRSLSARHLIPKYTGLRRDLLRYLDYYNFERAHTGRWNRGRTPEEVLGKAKCYG